ncbi:unnamed protein product [Prorocentrum cordatum]|uniref:Helicase C-terminal domain-containing protein n=1 Tax=Prorocentrum cordatum TaxID=2364126 RepID=A0ABN9XNR5_9DINO|nr:unnamed protein product [Polarella glacialis]
MKERRARGARTVQPPADALAEGESEAGGRRFQIPNLFPRSSSVFVLLLSLEQSASGTNLTAASHVVFLHPMLAPTPEQAIGHELQAIGRARRQGQRRDTVHVWRFVTSGTVEQMITERHQSALREREQAADARRTKNRQAQAAGS